MIFKYLKKKNNNNLNLFIPTLFGFKHNKLVKTFYYENMYYKIFYLIFNHISLLDVFFKRKKIFYNFVQYFQLNLYTYLSKKSNKLLLDLIFYFFYVLFITFENFQNYNYNNLILKSYKLRQQYRNSYKFKFWLKNKTSKFYFYNYINSISLYVLNYNIYKNFYFSKFNLFLKKTVFIYKLFYYFKILQYKIQSFCILYKKHFKIEKNLRLFFAKNNYLISKFLKKKSLYWFYKYKLNLLKLKYKKNLNKIINSNNVKSKTIRTIKKKIVKNIKGEEFIKDLEKKFNIIFSKESYEAFIKINFLKYNFDNFYKIIFFIKNVSKLTNKFEKIFWYLFYSYISKWKKQLINQQLKKTNISLFVYKLKRFIDFKFYKFILINFNLNSKKNIDIYFFFFKLFKIKYIYIYIYKYFSTFHKFVYIFDYVINNFYMSGLEYSKNLFEIGDLASVTKYYNPLIYFWYDIPYFVRREIDFNIYYKKINFFYSLIDQYIYNFNWNKKNNRVRKILRLRKYIGIKIPYSFMRGKSKIEHNKGIFLFWKFQIWYYGQFSVPDEDFFKFNRYIKFNSKVKKWIQLNSLKKKIFFLNLLSKKFKIKELNLLARRIRKKKKKIDLLFIDDVEKKKLKEKINFKKILNINFNKIEKLFLKKKKINIDLKNQIIENKKDIKKNIFFDNLFKLLSMDFYYKNINENKKTFNKIFLNKKFKLLNLVLKHLKNQFNKNFKNENYYLCILIFNYIKCVKFKMKFIKSNRNLFNLKKKIFKRLKKKKSKKIHFLKFFPLKKNSNSNFKKFRFNSNIKKQNNNKFRYSKFYRFYNKFQYFNPFLKKIFKYIQNKKYNKYVNFKFINYNKLRSQKTLKKNFIDQFRYNFQLFNPRFFKNKKSQRKFFYNLFIKKKIKTKYFRNFKTKIFQKKFFEIYNNLKKKQINNKTKKKNFEKKKKLINNNHDLLLLNYKLNNVKLKKLVKNNIDLIITKKIWFLRKYNFFKILKKMKKKNKLYYNLFYKVKNNFLIKLNKLQIFYNYLNLKKKKLLNKFKFIKNKFVNLIKIKNNFRDIIYYKINLIKLKKLFKFKLLFLNNKLLFLFNFIKNINLTNNYKLNLKELKLNDFNCNLNKHKFIIKPLLKKDFIKKNSFNKFFFLKKKKFIKSKFLVSLKFLNSYLGLQYKKFIRSSRFRKLSSFKRYYKNFLKFRKINPYKFNKLKLNYYMRLMAYNKFKQSNFFFKKKKKKKKKKK